MKIKGRGITGGTAEGAVLKTDQEISFLGGVDPDTGRITDPEHELKDEEITDKILVFPRGKGSTVGSYVLYQLKKNNKAPKAIINIETEPIVAVGAVISEIPLIDQIDIDKIPQSGYISMDATKGTIEIERQRKQ
ncbi:DUF126 domain-containing protein [Methanonatronarchaeum sp. AMET6-2]|uniref:DUF126 domain-containing protein n=1 Tax=Methanonatronarchaeum sp. AMET6-2 TaxID=2933293 RepID=UPI001204F498|nr:DUF126 domain-containing protein [Methanonatronarchaeum sp. AMET6-2]RZN63180.1 MAG: DUF126 domain-containing protein [Methanonatronarchaeia archaeon]UOY09455.1 DUF126 domain-containing protein [Methanonatronarchaeum sp. AMET6-2]